MDVGNWLISIYQKEIGILQKDVQMIVDQCFFLGLVNVIKYCDGCCRLTRVPVDAWLTFNDNDLYRCKGCMPR